MHCIQSHPIAHAPKPQTLEAKCLADADRLDAIRSFVPQIYLKFRAKYPEDQAWELTFDRIQGWYQSMSTDPGKSEFIKIKEQLHAVFPTLSNRIL